MTAERNRTDPGGDAMAGSNTGASEQGAFGWQVGIWDRISDTYVREIDTRFVPVVERLLARAALASGERVLDLGTGTGAVAVRAALLVGKTGQVLAVDPSPQMLALAGERVASLGAANVIVREGRGEAIPADDATFDAVLASLSLMYHIDRAAAAREIARVLRPGGRLVAAVWAGPDECDIVRFQQTAGRFAPAPPVPGVGPGAMADAAPFVAQLADAGIDATVERETTSFQFPTFESAWDVLAGVTAAGLPPEQQQQAKAAVMAAMWPEPDKPRDFHNGTQFIVGRRVR
jgi:ubiquinone/menaquinone biosynthesis C-methylase UbiE